MHSLAEYSSYLCDAEEDVKYLTDILDYSFYMLSNLCYAFDQEQSFSICLVQIRSYPCWKYAAKRVHSSFTS